MTESEPAMREPLASESSYRRNVLARSQHSSMLSFGAGLAAAALLTTCLAGPAFSADQHWIETYIEANGGCGSLGFSLSMLLSGQERQSPFGKPAQLWSDDDLAYLSRALTECRRKADLTGNHFISEEVQADIRRVVPEVEGIVRRARLERERQEAQAKARKALAEEQAAKAKEHARREREAAEERARQAEAERVAAEEVARQEKARAAAALREQQARAATERARREAAQARAELANARQQPSVDRRSEVIAAPGQPFCTEYQKLQDYMLALVNQDRQRASGITGCGELAAGTKVSVLEDYPSGTAIRHVVRMQAVSPSGTSAVGYTLSIGLKHASGEDY